MLFRSYFSQTWIQRNVLRLNDDEIKQMQGEIDEEKAMGLGLPVGVTNDVAQTQMVGDVQGEQQAIQAQHQAEIDLEAQEAAAKLQPKKEEVGPGVFTKLKQIL